MGLFTSVHQRRVERLATAIESAKAYNQERITHECGTPACALGHARVVFKRNLLARNVMILPNNMKAFIFGPRPRNFTDAAAVYDRNVFGTYGCGNAGRSGKKAAAFLRQMARDLKAAQQ